MTTQEIPGGYGRVSHIIQLTGDAEPMVITMGAGPSIGGTTDPEDALSVFAGAASVALPPCMHSVYKLVRTELHYHETSEGPDDPLRVMAQDHNLSGTRTEVPLPQNCAVLVHKRTNIAGRHGRGRFYLPGLPEGSVGETGIIVGELVTVLATRMQGYFTAVNGHAAAPDLFPYLLHARVEPPAVGVSPTPITSLSVDPRIATQRRRLRR